MATAQSSGAEGGGPGAKPKPPPITNMSPTQWAQQMLGDLGAPINANTTEDVLNWMQSEETTPTWWGGFGTASDPTRLNPLNAGDIGNYGYAGSPLTGNTLLYGLGTYPTLMNAAAASAQMVGQGNMSAIKKALMASDNPQQFLAALQSSPWAGGHYAGDYFSLANAQQEAGGPNVTAGIGSQVGPIPQGGGSAASQAAGSGIAGVLGSQSLPPALQALLENALAQQQMQLSPAVVQNQLDILKQNYGFSQQQFGVQAAQLGLQGKSFQEQLANLYAQYNPKTGQGFQQRQDILTGQNITRSIQDILKNYGQTVAGLNIQQQQGRAGLAASGVFTSGSRGVEEQQMSLARQQAATAEQTALFQQQQAQKGLQLTEDEQKQQFGYSQQQIQQGMAQLKLQYKSLGISEQQAQAQYNNAVQQIGLGQVMNGIQLEQQIAAMAGGGYSPMAGIMGQLANVLPFLGGMFTQPGGQIGG
jgi:hypothetical protein